MTVHGAHAVVVEVESSDFDRVVRDSPSDVLLMLYDPSCGMCIKALAQLEALAIELRSVPTVVVAAMDVTRQHVPGDLQWTDVPTAIFFPALTVNSGDSGLPSAAAAGGDGAGHGGAARGHGASASSRRFAKYAAQLTRRRAAALPPIVYDGPLDSDGMLRFLHQHCRDVASLPAPRDAEPAVQRKWSSASGIDAFALFDAMRNELSLLQEQMESLTMENSVLKQRLETVSASCGTASQSAIDKIAAALDEDVAAASRATRDEQQLQSERSRDPSTNEQDVRGEQIRRREEDGAVGGGWKERPSRQAKPAAGGKSFTDGWW